MEWTSSKCTPHNCTQVEYLRKCTKLLPWTSGWSGLGFPVSLHLTTRMNLPSSLRAHTHTQQQQHRDPNLQMSSSSQLLKWGKNKQRKKKMFSAWAYRAVLILSTQTKTSFSSGWLTTGTDSGKSTLLVLLVWLVQERHRLLAQLPGDSGGKGN